MATSTAYPMNADDNLEQIGMPCGESPARPTSENLPVDESSGLPMLSRRAMLGGLAASALAMSGMMLLPKERGGILFAGFNPLGADKAHADTVWSGSFSFQVVGADEIGIQILDVSGLTNLDDETVEKQGAPVEDATVTLTSLYNGEVASGSTDEEGKVILPIGGLAFSIHPSDGIIRANCTLSVTTEDARVKMRDFSTGRMCLEGATGYIVGVHKLDDTAAYMERCTFDDWDIHYSKLTFLRSGMNDEEHTVHIRARGMNDGDTVTLEVLNASTKKTVVGKKTSTVALDSKTGLAECSFKGQFLQTGHKDCISADDAIIQITLNTGGTSYVTDIEMSIEDTPFDDVVLSKPILPILSDPNRLLSFDITGDWPCFNGLSLSVLAPFPLVQISTMIRATFIGVGTNLSTVGDDGKWGPKGCWKKDHKGNIFKRYHNMVERGRQELDRRRDSDKSVEMQEIDDPGDPGSKMPQTVQQKVKLLGNLQGNIIGRLSCFLQWNGKKGDDCRLATQGTVALGFDFSGTLTLTFMAGPVPMYLSGTLGATLLGCFNVVGSHVVPKETKELDASDVKWALNKSASMLIKLYLNISLGVGYKGICTFSFDASFAFPFLLSWLQAGGEGKKDPRFTIGSTILLEFVLQALLFRVSAQVYSYRNDNWYDSWTDDDSVSHPPALTGDDAWEGIEPRFRLTHPDGSKRYTITYDSNGKMMLNGEDPWSLAVPTTDAMMKGSKEADAKKAAGNSGQVLDPDALSEAFTPVTGASGVFKREANTGAGDPATVFTDKIPKAVVRADGKIATELVHCPGTNTFYFGETTPGVTPTTGSSGAGAPAHPTAGNAGDGARFAPLATGSLGIQNTSRFEGDPLLGFAVGATAEYEYTPVEGKTTFNPCDPIGIRGIAPHDGVQPSVDAVIYQNVHSDPRQRVVAIDNTLYLFRIATVEYPTAASGSYCRTRVVASKYDENTSTWGNPTVLEYNTGNAKLPRVNIYDYEFDIAVRTGSQKWTQNGEACLIVTGGLRPHGDSTSFHEAASSGTVAVLVIDKDLNVLHCVVRGVQGIDSSNAKLNFGDDEQFMLCSPCIVDGFAPDGASGSLAYAFLRRSSSSLLGLTSTAATVTFCVGHCYVRDGYLSFPADIKVNPDVALAADVFGMKAASGDAVKDKYDALLTLVINHQQGYDVCTATIPSGGDFSGLQITHCIQSSDKLPEIQPWPHHGTFLFVKERPPTKDGTPDYHLYQGSFDATTSGQTGFTPDQVDSAGIKGASFCVSPSGEFLFYYETFHDRPNSNPEADFVSSNVTGTGDDTVHRIMASRFLNGTFCEDFPFCEVDHPIDHLEVADLKDKASSFIATHITDADNSLANMHYIAVPNTLSAEIEAFVQSQPFVCAGKPAVFSMDVRNHGNLIIGGFELQMIDPDKKGEVIGSVHVGAIDPDKISPTAANMGWGNNASDTPRLTAEEEQGMLMPGRTISYSATFNIPETWRDKKTVIMRIADAWTPRMQPTSLTTASESTSGLLETNNGMVMRGTNDDVHHFHQAKEDDITLMDTGSGDGTVYDPDERVGTKPSPDSSNPGKEDGKAGANTKKASATAARTTPKTGDDLGSAGPVALAVAGAAALAAGYSVRRLQNEREARENEE